MTSDASTPTRYPESIVAAIATCLARSRPRLAGAWLVGISGLQGCGKNTFTPQLKITLAHQGVSSVAMSLDDFYFGRFQRRRLARAVHPLLATRGVPGTHELQLLNDTLAALARAAVTSPALVLRFEKGRDTRIPRARWQHITQPPLTQPPQMVPLEGWCVGVPSQS